MTTDAEDLIKELRLNEETNDPALSDARDFALRCLRSKAPIPQTVMTVVERGARAIVRFEEQKNTPVRREP